MSDVFHKVDGPNEKAFIFCDHASNHVPDWIGGLGVSETDMQRHIAWDIGSASVATQLCKNLNCSGLICGFSRLVIDANRDPAAPGLIPERSDGTDIPGNQNLSYQDRQARIDRLYQAYHTAIGKALDARPVALALSVHSFTPRLEGQPKRPTDIGLLVKDDTDTADRFVAEMATLAPELRVDINLPYSAYDLNFTVDHNVVPRGLPHLAIEIRQDHITDEPGQARYAELLARAIKPLI